MIDAEAERWVGLLTGLGVLIPLSLWFASAALGDRVRNVVAVVSGVTLAMLAAGAVGTMSLVGYTIATVTSDVGDDREGRAVLAAALAIVGLAAGLAVSLWLRSRDDEAGDWVAPETVEDEPPFEEDPPVADGSAPATPAAADAYWSSHGGGAPFAAPVAPVGAATLALLLIAVALALPSSRFTGFSSAFGFPDGDVGGKEAAAIVIDGVRHGLALLLAAFALRGRDPMAVLGSFGLVALGQGLATSFPDTFGNQFWYMFAAGVTAGLLLPPVLRLLTPALLDDRGAFAIGLAVVVALVGLQSWLSTSTVYDAGRAGLNIDTDVNVNIPSVPNVPLPTFPQPTPAFPSDFPTFQFPSGFPSNFPTFRFPSGFPTGP